MVCMYVRYTQAWCTCGGQRTNLGLVFRGLALCLRWSANGLKLHQEAKLVCLQSFQPSACPHLPLAITRVVYATVSGTHLGSVFQKILAHRGREDTVAGMGQSLGVRPYSNASSHEINQKAPRQGDQKQ